MNDHIASNPALAGLGAVQHAEHDGGDREDHDDLDAHGKGADEGAERTMDEIAYDEFVHDTSQYMRAAWSDRRGARCFTPGWQMNKI